MRILVFGLLLGIAGLACGGSEGESSSSSSSSSSGSSSGSSGTPDSIRANGTAAIGAPITATIRARCADGTTPTWQTDPQGNWSAQVPSAALPCVLAIPTSDPNVTLHSVLTSSARANVTPLTDLALALAAAQLPSAWFTSADWQSALAALPGAVTQLQNTLIAAGYTLPPGTFDPFGAQFSATPGDPWDDLLEAIAAGIAARSGTYADVLAQFAAGTPQLPNPPPSVDDFGLAGRNGVTGALDDTAYTFVDNVSWTPLLNGIGANGRDANGDVDTLTRWAIAGFPSALGTFPCKSINGTQPTVTLQRSGAIWSSAPEGGACTITITRINSEEIEGTFDATLYGPDGQLHPVSQGFFRKFNLDDGGGGMLPDGVSGASFVVDGKRYFYDSAANNSFETYSSMTLYSQSVLSPGTPQGIQMSTVPNALGTYACDSGSEYRKLNVWFYWRGEWFYAGRRAVVGPLEPIAGSSCSVTVTQKGTVQDASTYLGTFEATFNGTFVSADGSHSITVTDGKYRYVGATQPDIDPRLQPLVGTRNPVVVRGGNYYDLQDGAVVPVTVAANGDITVAGRTLRDYTVVDQTQGTPKEPGYLLKTPDVDGHAGPMLNLYMDGNELVGYSYMEIREVDGILVSFTLDLGFRPITQRMSDAIAALLPFHGTSVTNVAGVWQDMRCTTVTLDISGNASREAPMLSIWVPQHSTDIFSDSSARVHEYRGAETLTMFYTHYVLRGAGILEVRPRDGNTETPNAEVWTNDPAQIAAACP